MQRLRAWLEYAGYGGTVGVSNILSIHGVLEALRTGHYRVCPDTGEVTGPAGKVVTPFPSGRSGRLKFIRIYYQGKVKTLRLSKLVWMSQTRVPVPTGYEVHHWDENPENDVWDNLFCLHELDHRKLHRVMPKGFADHNLEEVPF